MGKKKREVAVTVIVKVGDDYDRLDEVADDIERFIFAGYYSTRGYLLCNGGDVGRSIHVESAIATGKGFSHLVPDEPEGDTKGAE